MTLCCVADELLSTVMSPSDAIISAPSQHSSLHTLSSHAKPTTASPPHKGRDPAPAPAPAPLMSPLLSPQDSLPLSPALGPASSLGPLSPQSPLPLQPSPLPSQEEWHEDNSGGETRLIQKCSPSEVQEEHSASLSEFLKFKQKRGILYDQKRIFLDYFREDSVWYTSTGTLVYFYDHSAILQLVV